MKTCKGHAILAVMTTDQPSNHVRPFLLSLGFVLGLGALQVLNSLGLAGSDDAWGVVPRSLDHLWGAATFHLRHANWPHYFSNAIPLLLLPGIAWTLAPKASRHAWWIIALGSGLFLWCFGRSAVHVGASAMVYGWFFFLVGMAIFHRSWASLLGLALVMGLFGGLIWVFAGGNSVSWEGHLGGALAGLLAARLTRPRRN